MSYMNGLKSRKGGTTRNTGMRGLGSLVRVGGLVRMALLTAALLLEGLSLGAQSSSVPTPSPAASPQSSSVPGATPLPGSVPAASPSSVPASAASPSPVGSDPAPAASDSSAALDFSEDDIFAAGAFDQEVDTGTAAAEGNGVSLLAGTTLVVNTNALILSASGNYGLRLDLGGRAFVKVSQPDLGALFASATYSQLVGSSSNDAGLQARQAASGQDLTAPVLGLSELHLSFDLGKVLFVRVGNQLLSWGASYFWSPVDFINFQPADSQASVDLRSGKSGVRLHVPFDGANLLFFLDLSRTVDQLGMSTPLTETAAYDFRADATFLGFNSGLVGSFGPGIPQRLGLSTTGQVAGIDLWGEFATVLPVEGYDFSWALSVGGEKSFGSNQEFTLRAEFFTQSDGADDAALSPAQAFTPYQLGKYYAYLGTTFAKLFGTDSTFGLSGVVNFSDLSWTASANLGLRFAKVLPIDLSLRYSGGPDDREFTVRTGGPAWSIGLRSVLTF